MGTLSSSDSCCGLKLSAARGLVLFFVLCTCDHSQRTSAGCFHLCAKKSLLLQKIYSNHCVKDIPSALIDQVMFNASYHSQIPWTFRFTCNKSWTHQIQVFLWVHHGSSHSIAHFGGLNSIEAPFLRWPWCWVVSKKQQTLCEDSNGLWGWPGYMVYKCVYIIYINVYKLAFIWGKNVV